MELGGIMGTSEVLPELESAFRTVFAGKKYKAIAAVSAVAVGLMAWLLPIYLIPGNTIGFWLAAAPWWSYLLLLVFSISVGILISFQAYIFSNRPSSSEKGAGGIFVFSGFISTAYSSVACAGCISIFAGFLGSGASLFLLNYRFEIIAFAFFLNMYSIYFASRTVNRKCTSCEIKGNRKGTA